MTTIEIVRWREDAVGFTVWDAHARSELKRRLGHVINASPGEIRSLARQVGAKQLLAIAGVRDQEVANLRQILETMGADVVAEPEVSS
jgi:hypothetical protein